MGLSNFPSPADGVLPIIVMNTVISVAILKKLVRSFLELVGISSTNFDENTTIVSSSEPCFLRRQKRGVCVVKFKSSNFALDGADNDSGDSCCEVKDTRVECCVCLCKFKEEEEVSELSCKHFFHKKCLDKWFDNHHTTCPLCRSTH